MKHAENVEIEIDGRNMIINAIYRAPKLKIKDFLKELKKWLKHKEVKNKEIIIIGDININTLKDNVDTQTYIEILSNEGIINTIRKITREEKVTQSSIDHINIRSTRKYTSGIVKEKIADHYFICTKIEDGKTKDEEKIIDIFIIDNDKIDGLISEFYWENLALKYQEEDDIKNI